MSRAVSDVDVFKVEHAHLIEKFGPELERNKTAAHFLLHEEAGSPEKGKGLTDHEMELLGYMSEDFKKLMIHTCKERSAQNIGNVDLKIKLANDMKCLESGVGSYGGHIAREFKSPGPCNGHNYIKLHERLLTGEPNKSQKEDFVAHPLVLVHPNWEANFVADNHISKSNKTTTLHNHDLELDPIVDNARFEAEVTKICHGSLHTHSITWLDNISNTHRYTHRHTHGQ